MQNRYQQAPPSYQTMMAHGGGQAAPNVPPPRFDQGYAIQPASGANANINHHQQNYQPRQMQPQIQQAQQIQQIPQIQGGIINPNQPQLPPPPRDWPQQKRVQAQQQQPQHPQQHIQHPQQKQQQQQQQQQLQEWRCTACNRANGIYSPFCGWCTSPRPPLRPNAVSAISAQTSPVTGVSPPSLNSSTSPTVPPRRSAMSGAPPPPPPRDKGKKHKKAQTDIHNNQKGHRGRKNNENNQNKGPQLSNEQKQMLDVSEFMSLSVGAVPSRSRAGALLELEAKRQEELEMEQQIQKQYQAQQQQQQLLGGQWACTLCTFLNPANVSQCDACLTQRAVIDTIERNYTNEHAIQSNYSMLAVGGSFYDVSMVGGGRHGSAGAGMSGGSGKNDKNGNHGTVTHHYSGGNFLNPRGANGNGSLVQNKLPRNNPQLTVGMGSKVQMDMSGLKRTTTILDEIKGNAIFNRKKKDHNSGNSNNSGGNNYSGHNNFRGGKNSFDSLGPDLPPDNKKKNKNNKQNKNNNNPKMAKDIPDLETARAEFHAICSEIACRNDNPVKVFNTLRGVTKKLITDDDPRYRVLDVNNQKVVERLLGYDGVIEFLHLLGFEIDDTASKLIVQTKPKFQHLSLGLEVLNQFKKRWRMYDNEGAQHNGRGNKGAAHYMMRAPDASGVNNNQNNRRLSYDKTQKNNNVPPSPRLFSPPNPGLLGGSLNNQNGKHGYSNSASAFQFGSDPESPRVSPPKGRGSGGRKKGDVPPPPPGPPPPKGKVGSLPPPHLDDDENLIDNVHSTPGFVDVFDDENVAMDELNLNNNNSNSNNNNNDGGVLMEEFKMAADDADNAFSLNQILLLATHESLNVRDDQELEVLLMTHKTHWSSLVLLQALRQRYNYNHWETEQLLQKCQLKVGKCVRRWMKDYWKEDWFGASTKAQFYDDNNILFAKTQKDKINMIQHNEMFIELQSWIDEMKESNFRNPKPWVKTLADALTSEFDRYLKKGPASYHRKEKNYDRIKIPKRFDLKNTSTDDFADQLTLICYRIFASIKPREFVGKAWTKKEKNLNRKLAPNVLRMTDLFNRTCTFFQVSILTEKSLKLRVKALKKILKIGERLRKRNNYHCLLALFAALNSAAIFNLKTLWSKLNTDSMQTFKAFKSIFSIDNNYRALRLTIRQSVGACIPYIGIYLQDLVFIEDGNAKTRQQIFENHKLFNFSKSMRIADRIQTIQFHQMTPYKDIKENEVVCKCLIDTLQNFANITSEDLFEQAQQIKQQDLRSKSKPSIFS